MTQEGLRPFTPLTTKRLRELLDEVDQESNDMGGHRYGVLSADDIRSTRHAIAELIDLREQITKIAAICPHVPTIRALHELLGPETRGSIIGPNNKQVAMATLTGENDPMDRDAAARLIAAASDLLEAVKTTDALIQTWRETGKEPTLTEWMSIQDKCRATIAKVTGDDQS